MSTQTTNYGLVKPDTSDFYDIATFNDNADIIDVAIHKLSTEKAEQTAVDELKKSVSDGKTLVANAITGKGVATATDAAFATMATNISNIQTNPTLQSKTAVLSTSAQTIKADSGYDGLSQVTVPAVVGTSTVGDVLSGKTFSSASGVNQTGTMTNNGAISQTLNAGGSYTIPSGYHNGSGKVTANSLANQTAGSATATQILYGQTAWVGGVKLTGSMNNVAGQYASPVSMQMNTNLDIVPAQGYYNGSNAYVAITPPTLASAIGLTAAKLVSGNTILGIAGTTAPRQFASGTITGHTKDTYKTFSVYLNGSSTTATLRYFVLNCSFVPSFIIFTAGTSALPGYYRGFVSNSTPFGRNSMSYIGFSSVNGYTSTNYVTTIGTSTEVALCESGDVTTVDITWYAFA